MIELGHETDRRPPFCYARIPGCCFSWRRTRSGVGAHDGRYMPYFDLARTSSTATSAASTSAASGLRDPRIRGRDPRTGAVRRPARGLRRIERIGTTSITYDHAAFTIDDEPAGGEGDVLMGRPRDARADRSRGAATPSRPGSVPRADCRLPGRRALTRRRRASEIALASPACWIALRPRPQFVLYSPLCGSTRQRNIGLLLQWEAVAVALKRREYGLLRSGVGCGSGGSEGESHQ